MDIFPPEMALMNISASFPHGMDAPADSQKTTQRSKFLAQYDQQIQTGIICYPTTRHELQSLKTAFVRGHPFMTSTRRGEGVRLRWTHVNGGRGSSPMWTSTQKIKIRVH